MKNEINEKCYIYARYYYNGTYGAKEDGALLDFEDFDYATQKHPKIIFDSKQEARDFLINDLKCRQYGSINSYCYDYVYMLNYGEYSAPDFNIRKIRK
jgi:hypothetical protein